MNIEARSPGETAARVAEQVEEIAHDVADSLHSAASTIRKRGEKSSKAIEHIAKSAAARFDEAGAYIEEHDLKHAIKGSRQLVR